MYLSRIFKIMLLCSGAAFATLQARAQAPKGFNLMTNTNELQAGLAKTTQATQTISSDFSQVKHMKMMDDKVSSKGRFYFKKEDRIRIEYTSPFQYLLVMNGGQIMVKDENKASKINTRNSKTMQSANRIMMDCMRGTVFGNKDFNVKSYAGATQYLLELVPVNAAMKSLFARIQVFISKSDFSVAKLVMTENGGDYTDMNFANKKINTTLPDALFSVR